MPKFPDLVKLSQTIFNENAAKDLAGPILEYRPDRHVEEIRLHVVEADLGLAADQGLCEQGHSLV